MYRSNTIANMFIRRSIADGKLLTPMQINKLVFLAHGLCLATMSKPLINEVVYAWKWGPVIRTIYTRFQPFGSKPVDRVILDDAVEREEIESLAEENQDEVKLINTVWRFFGEKTGPELSTLTHLNGSPWHTIWEVNGGKHKRDAVIPDTIIQEYYTKQLQQYRNRISSSNSSANA
jgi:uncharacterized phage-associated protein